MGKYHVYLYRFEVQYGEFRRFDAFDYDGTLADFEEQITEDTNLSESISELYGVGVAFTLKYHRGNWLMYVVEGPGVVAEWEGLPDD